jgi:hypothetical protein
MPTNGLPFEHGCDAGGARAGERIEHDTTGWL